MSEQQGTDADTKQQAEWRDRLERQAASGQTVRTFCQSESIATQTFYRWRGRLRARDEARTNDQVQVVEPGAFIDAGTVVAGARRSAVADTAGSRPSSLTGGIEIRLELGGGVVLQLTRA